MKSKKPLAVFACLILSLVPAVLLSGCASVSSAIVPGERFVTLESPGAVYAIGQIIEMASSRVEVVYDSRLPSDLASEGPGELPAAAAKSLAARCTAIAKTAMDNAGAQLGDVKVEVTFRDSFTRTIPTYSLYKHIQDQMTKNDELRSMILNYAAVGARFEVVSGSIHGSLALTITDATGKSLELDPAVLASIAEDLNVRLKRDSAASAYVSEPVELGFYADRRMVRALTSAAENDLTAAAKSSK